MASNPVISKLEAKLPGTVLEKQRFGRSEKMSVWIEVGNLPKVARMLKEDPELRMGWLENLSAIQMDQALVLTYFLRSAEHGHELILRASVVPEAANSPVSVPSCVEIWPMGRLIEWEIEDLFGVTFEGNRGPNPGAWQGFPLRKSYPFTRKASLADDSEPSNGVH